MFQRQRGKLQQWPATRVVCPENPGCTSNSPGAQILPANYTPEHFRLSAYGGVQECGVASGLYPEQRTAEARVRQRRSAQGNMIERGTDLRRNNQPGAAAG